MGDFSFAPCTPAGAFSRATEVERVNQWKQEQEQAQAPAGAIQDEAAPPTLKVGSLSKAGIKGLVPLSYKFTRSDSAALAPIADKGADGE
mmetsp:Transcript_97900/g.299181  ORF Transcript_97900/g.299181 Transcript_97900/m.299181 type:complete len:90 (-) Transcript_97900:147-416(-)